MPPLTPAPRRWWRVVVLAVVLVIAGGLDGCGSTRQATPAQPADVQAHWAGCEAVRAFDDSNQDAGPPDPGPLPAGFNPTQALICARGERTTAAGEVVQVGLERRADDIAPLLSYLARPSVVSDQPDDLVCAAMAVLPTWLFLTDATGRWVTPAVPTDACGFPLDTFTEAGPAYQTLRYRDTVVKQIRVTESAEAHASGCAMQWKNMVPVEARTPREPIVDDPFSGAAIRVCRYEVPAEEQATETPVGDLLGGQTLTRKQRGTVLKAVVGSKPAPQDCDAQAGRFAVLQATGGDPVVYVELDGCRRILVPAGQQGSFLAQASPTLVKGISAFGA